MTAKVADKNNWIVKAENPQDAKDKPARKYGFTIILQGQWLHLQIG